MLPPNDVMHIISIVKINCYMCIVCIFALLHYVWVQSSQFISLSGWGKVSEVWCRWNNNSVCVWWWWCDVCVCVGSVPRYSIHICMQAGEGYVHLSLFTSEYQVTFRGTWHNKMQYAHSVIALWSLTAAPEVLASSCQTLHVHCM